jgi:hypothetical protein
MATKRKNTRINAANGPIPPTPGEGNSIFFPKAYGYNDGPQSIVSVAGSMFEGAPIPGGPDAMTDRLGSAYGNKKGKRSD